MMQDLEVYFKLLGICKSLHDQPTSPLAGLDDKVKTCGLPAFLTNLAATNRIAEFLAIIIQFPLDNLLQLQRCINSISQTKIKWLQKVDLKQLTISQLQLMKLPCLENLAVLNLKAMAIEAASSNLDTVINEFAATILRCAKLQKLYLGFAGSSNYLDHSKCLGKLLQAIIEHTDIIAAPKLLVISLENPLPVLRLKQFFANRAIFAATQSIDYQAPNEKAWELLKIILATAPQLQEISAPQFITTILNRTTSHKLIVTAARAQQPKSDPVIYFNSKHKKKYTELVYLLNEAKQYQLTKFVKLLDLLELLLVDSAAKKQLERIDIAKCRDRQMLFARSIMVTGTIKLTSSFDLPGLLQQELEQQKVSRNQAIKNLIASIYEDTEKDDGVNFILCLLIAVAWPCFDFAWISFMLLAPIYGSINGPIISIAFGILMSVLFLSTLYCRISHTVNQQATNEIPSHEINNKLFWLSALHLRTQVLSSTLLFLIVLLCKLLLPAFAIMLLTQPEICAVILWIATVAIHIAIEIYRYNNSWVNKIATSIEREEELVVGPRRDRTIKELAEFLAPEPEPVPYGTIVLILLIANMATRLYRATYRYSSSWGNKIISLGRDEEIKPNPSAVTPHKTSR